MSDEPEPCLAATRARILFMKSNSFMNFNGFSGTDFSLWLHRGHRLKSVPLRPPFPTPRLWHLDHGFTSVTAWKVNQRLRRRESRPASIVSREVEKEKRR